MRNNDTREGTGWLLPYLPFAGFWNTLKLSWMWKNHTDNRKIDSLGIYGNSASKYPTHL